ncbi:MAG: type II secretion system protein [Gemmata sp.]
MLRQRRGGRRRDAFTLIELLVVIGIIVILMSLTVAGAMRVRGAAVRTENVDRMKQIENAYNQCVSQESMGRVGYLPTVRTTVPPSPGGGVFRIRKSYPATGFTYETTYLTQMFSQINLGNTGAVADVDLQDDNEVAVFFLTGGTVTDYEGFSNNPQQPFAPKSLPDEQRKVFIKGVPKRWLNSTGLRFVDSYDTPYTVFLPNRQGSYSSCLPANGVNAYRRGTKFENPKSMQIISAGINKQFGPGGDWSGGASAVGATGRDDVSNFSPSEHAAGPQ